jgi:proteasome assembly chaperone (PAC2) family protein
MATVSIQVPMLEMKLPVQTVAKARCRNGRNGDTRVGWAGLVTQQGYRDLPDPARGRRAGAEPATLPAMGKLLDLADVPTLRDPFLVVHLHGWTDAGLAAQTAAVFLRSRWNATPLATFDADELIDFRARRPIARLAGGTIEAVTWSPTELLLATPGGERDAVLLLGPEPDFRWRAFCDEVVEACRRLQVVEVFGLGAFPAPALHTDPVAVVGTSADSDLAARLETVPAIVELSSGIQTVLEERLHRAGVPATGLWARVPPYLAGGAHPPAALALVQTLSRLAGVEIETTELEAATKDHLEQVEQAIRERPQIAEFVDQIRGLVEQGADERIPSGDEIAAELERFLNQGPPDTDPS